ncbi:MAG: hypothetical protein ACE5KY_06500 [Candidatus Tectimicrobiota bacterium]
MGLAASLIQTSNALVRTVHLARRATVALGELAAISLVLPVPLLTSFETPLPLAQHGAIVEQPTLVVAGHGRELIVPARREQRSPEVQAEFERLAAAEGEPITIVVPVRLDGRQIAKAVVRHQRRGAA